MESKTLGMIAVGNGGTIASIGRIEEIDVVDDASADGRSRILHTPATHNYHNVRANDYAHQHNGDLYIYGHYYENVTEIQALRSAVDTLQQEVGLIKHLLENPGQASSHPDAIPRPRTTPWFSTTFHENDERTIRHPVRRKYAHVQKSTRFVLRLRPRFLSKLWQASVVRSQAGWNANIQVWNIVPGESAVFEYARCGDINAIMELVEHGEASPFDLTPYGLSIADIAMWESIHGHEWQEIVRFYLDATKADVNQLFFDASIILPTWTIRMFVNEYDLCIDNITDLCDRDKAWRLKIDAESAEAVALLQKAIPWEYATVPPADRLTFACGTLGNTPTAFIHAVGFAASPQGIAKAKTIHNYTAMHHVADRTSSDVDMEVGHWCSLVRTLHENGACMHALDDRRRSPFMVFLERVPYFFRSWLDLLASAGVDIGRYGWEESDLWRREDLHVDYWQDAFDIVHFSYGPRQCDWELTIQALINLPLYKKKDAMPGSWLDERVEKYSVHRICWYPNEKEKSEGEWVYECHRRVRCHRRIMEGPPTQPERRAGLTFPGLNFQGTTYQNPSQAIGYDDSAPLVLKLQRSNLLSRLDKRGSSQPPFNHVASHENRDFGDFHVCCMTSPPRLVYGLRYGAEARDCVGGFDNDHDEYWRSAREELERLAYWDDFLDSDDTSFYSVYMPRRRADARARIEAQPTTDSERETISRGRQVDRGR